MADRNRGLSTLGLVALVTLAVVAACGGDARSDAERAPAGSGGVGATAGTGGATTSSSGGVAAANSQGGSAAWVAEGGVGGADVPPGTIPPDWTASCDPSVIGPCGGQRTYEAESMELDGAVAEVSDWAYGGMVVVLEEGDQAQLLGMAPTGDLCTLTIAYTLWDPAAEASSIVVGSGMAGGDVTVPLPAHDPSTNGLQYGLVTAPFSTGSVWTLTLTGAGPAVAIDRVALEC